MKKTYLALIAAAAFALFGCNQTTEPTSLSLKAKDATIAAQVQVTGTSCVNLIGGQTNVIGTVCNTVEGEYLVVTVSTNSGMDNVYIWADTAWNSWPKKAKNNPSPAHAKFPYLSGALAGATTYKDSIPLSKFGIDYLNFCGSTKVYLIVHASGSGYTAFGAFGVKDLDVSGGGNWAYGYQLTLTGVPPTISYNPSSVVGTVGQPITPITPTTTGTILSCSAPGLPAGLMINPDCSITGTPTGASSGTYTVTAEFQCGSSSTTVTITVVPPTTTENCNSESATGTGTSQAVILGRGNQWFMVTHVTANPTVVPLQAGSQSGNNAGIITISGGQVNIELTGNWKFKTGVTANVYVGGYAAADLSVNFNPGGSGNTQFSATGTSFTTPVDFSVAGSEWVYVHASVTKCE
jgi:hypothetical protein